MSNFEDLKGMILKEIKVHKENGDENGDRIVFTSNDDRIFVMRHKQDCCETVEIESIDGDLHDLIGVPILVAEENSNADEDSEYDSATWTFYKLATKNGYVDIRWFGHSNGSYSERVDFIEIDNE